MKFGIKFRLVALGVAIAVMGALIVLATLDLQRRSVNLRARLSQVGSESFGIATVFGARLRELNDSLYQYGKSHVSPNIPAFSRASQELNFWIDEQKSKLATAEEKDVMEKIDAAYDSYLLAATNLLVRLEAIGETSATIDEYNGLREESARLFVLSQSLARAHLASQTRLLTEAGQSANSLRVRILVLLGGLFLAGLALAWVVYRDMIAPLRLKLVESQALAERQEKLASLGMLAAGVAHEIRNPLTAIKAAAFLQQRKSEPASQEHADAELLLREVSRLERIVNDFLQFARPGDPALTTIPAELPLKEVQLLLGPPLVEAQIRLALEPSVPMRINADAAQIKQVLINLVRNAADSIGREGTITLRARSTRKRLAGRETGVIILEVADTGKGIPPEVEKRLFDPFFTTKDSGTGLGLSIAARIVHEHGGALEYQTQLHRGTTFGIVLPRATE
jgi:signal transduction histidine kinase